MEYEDSKRSRFNAGVAHTERIDALQRAINSAKFNPFMRNFETGTYNYEVMITSIDCLVAEGWDKFSETEQKMIARMNDILQNLNRLAPPLIINKNGEMKINKENYEKLMLFFQLMERKIKELYGKHNLNSPTDEDDDGL